MTDNETTIARLKWMIEHCNEKGTTISFNGLSIEKELRISIEALEKLNAIETIIDTDYVQEDVFNYKAIVNTVKESKYEW